MCRYWIVDRRCLLYTWVSEAYHSHHLTISIFRGSTFSRDDSIGIFISLPDKESLVFKEAHSDCKRNPHHMMDCENGNKGQDTRRRKDPEQRRVNATTSKPSQFATRGSTTISQTDFDGSSDVLPTKSTEDECLPALYVHPDGFSTRSILLTSLGVEDMLNISDLGIDHPEPKAHVQMFTRRRDNNNKRRSIFKWSTATPTWGEELSHSGAITHNDTPEMR